MSNTPNNAIPYVPQNTLDPAAGLNLALAVVDALLNTKVISMAVTAPPGSPADGDMYIVPAGATGAWAGHTNALAQYVADGAFWQFYPAGTQAVFVINKADNNVHVWNFGTSAWQVLGSVPANLIPFTPNSASGLHSTNVQDALNELGARP